MSKNLLRVRTPAKLILSGEHAVVHGHPAIALSIDRYTHTTVQWGSPTLFSFNLTDVPYKHRLTIEALRTLKLKVTAQYNQYKQGRLPIHEVLQDPSELSLFTTINVLDQLGCELPMELDITTDSNIPIGCGMGSSAASIVGILQALVHFLAIDLPVEERLAWAIESENLQHGRSSGIDIHTVYHGGALYYEAGTFESRQFAPFPMTLVQTGCPQSSTGECVSHADPYFKNSGIGADFSAVTHEFNTALMNNNITQIQTCIRNNHRLLNKIGVVPNRVNEFIDEIEKTGAAAKICGAGSIVGDQGGIVLVVSETDITPIAEAYGYPIMHANNDQRGTCVV